MIADIRAMAAETGTPISPQVLAAIAEVPRHLFVPAAERYAAYANHPLPIGHGQTISQPYIVALMTDLLELNPHATVLEIGTGCGYQTAVLATLAGQVYSVEIVAELASLAAGRLHELGHRNVEVRHGDGHQGWTERAPFDAIIVTAAADRIPPALLDQLKPGGRMVIPIGGELDTQELLLASKDRDGTVQCRGLLAVRFVPMTGGGY